MDHRPTRFAHDRLDAYAFALDFYRGVEEVAGAFPRGYAELKDQLRRAAGGTVLNIAEGANRIQPRDKAARFTLARAECGEAAAALQMAEVVGIVGPKRSLELRSLADRISAMLLGLIRRERGRVRP